MYHTILIPVENGPADQVILDHIKPLAKMNGARLLLIHVADGWAARNYDQLNLVESEEMRADRDYLARRVAELAGEGFIVDCLLEKGEPSAEIIRVAGERKVDLIAMATHGHRFLGDLIHGSTADKVRHVVTMPVLLLKDPARAA